MGLGSRGTEAEIIFFVAVAYIIDNGRGRGSGTIYLGKSLPRCVKFRHLQLFDQVVN